MQLKLNQKIKLILRSKYICPHVDNFRLFEAEIHHLDYFDNLNINLSNTRITSRIASNSNGQFVVII